VQMYDQAVNQGADPQPFNEQRCTRSGMLLGALPVPRQLCGECQWIPGYHCRENARVRASRHPVWGWNWNL